MRLRDTFCRAQRARCPALELQFLSFLFFRKMPPARASPRTPHGAPEGKMSSYLDMTFICDDIEPRPHILDRIHSADTC